MNETGISIELKAGIAQITIDRPPVNAVDSTLLDALNRALDTLEAEPEVRVGVMGAVLNSRDIFIVGADIRHLMDIGPKRARAFTHHYQQTCTRLAMVPWPTIIALHGRVLGGGLELALSCDVRVAARGTQIGFPEGSLGLIPGAGGTQRLVRQVPVGVAKDWIFRGEPIPVERAHQYGLVQEVLEPAEVMSFALDWAKKVAAKGPVAVKAMKKAIAVAVDTTLAEGLALERELSDQCWQTADAREGLTAFLEKRPPQFVGR